jgi:peptidoglycan hydrolase CwlO-like protein
MSKKHYLKSDGNGGFNIGKHTFTVISLLLVIIGMVASASISYGMSNQKISEVKEIIPSILNSVETVKGRVSSLESSSSAIDVKLDYISEDVKEIKELLKEDLQ